jgi:adenylate kinase family enzyme
MSEIQRVNVVGSSGSGKSTVGRQIATRLGLPFVELDDIHWRPNWTESTDEELFSNLGKALAGEGWVLDGNYSRTVPVKWKRVQLIVWLDLPYWLIMYQVISRTFRRSFNREILWAGNQESLTKAFFDKDSIILWSLSNLSRVRRGYSQAMSDDRYRHIQFVRLRSRREIREFLSALPIAQGASD